MKDCKNCEYRKYIARTFDVHIDEHDCWLEKCFLEMKEEENEQKNIRSKRHT